MDDAALVKDNGESNTGEVRPPVKKIKVVISDLHLGKGRILENGGLNSLEEFYYGEKLVEFIHYYSTGIYRDHEVELVINGDFLNCLQVDYRGHFLTVITEQVALEVIQSIVRGHEKVFKAMGEFASRPGKSITYIVGNHDQSMLWPACRNYLNQVIGAQIRYKNIVYFFDGVHIEHGHMHEAANRMDPKKFFLKKDLPEPILNLPFGSHFFVEHVLRIKEKYPHIDKIRPFSKMIRWAMINETWAMVVTFWMTVWYFVRSIFVADPRRAWPFRRVVQVVLESAIFPDLSESARKVLQDERVHTVIFGHSHVYQYRQWSSNKEYFNTGTWTEITSLDIVSLGKITKLTYVLIEYPEDGGRPRGRLKEWKGYHRIEEDVAVS
ncbi:MAG: metallophosphoesterase [Bdellovibrionaceae bacterium]|nr:metallophosphoesterase [Pseudobdellovibrionaceae bacterium]MBX3034813.1 metallophosphoesterase [Pseudobdellovibrionaceae bacterium]